MCIFICFTFSFKYDFMLLFFICFYDILLAILPCPISFFFLLLTSLFWLVMRRNSDVCGWVFFNNVVLILFALLFVFYWICTLSKLCAIIDVYLWCYQLLKLFVSVFVKFIISSIVCSWRLCCIYLVYFFIWFSQLCWFFTQIRLLDPNHCQICVI